VCVSCDYKLGPEAGKVLSGIKRISMSFSTSTSKTTANGSKTKSKSAVAATVDDLEFALNDFGSPPSSPARAQPRKNVTNISDEPDQIVWPPPRATQAGRRAKIEAAAVGAKSSSYDRDPAILAFEELKALRHEVNVDFFFCYGQSLIVMSSLRPRTAVRKLLS
jgi:hypothetical protein